MLSPVWSPYSKIPSQSPLLLLLWTQDPTTLAEMRALGFQFRAGDAGVHFVATPLGTQLSIAKLYTWLARKSPKWRFLAVKIIERHEGVFFPQAMCVCVKRLHRRKTSVVTHRIIYNILLYYIKYIILYLKAGGHRGPGGVGGQRRHPPGPV